MNHLKALRKYFWKYRFRLFMGILFIIISNYFSILPPQLTSFVVNKVQHIVEGSPETSLLQTDPVLNYFIRWINGLKHTQIGSIVALCGLAILLLALIRGIFMFFMRQTIIVMSRHIEYDQKNEIYDHYQNLDTQFYKTNSIGDMMNRIAEDVSRVRMYTGPVIMYTINLVTIIIFCVAHMWANEPVLTLYVLAPLPILAFVIYYVNRIIHHRSEKIQGLLSDLTTNAQQSYSGIRVIKSYVQEKTMFHFFKKNSESYRKHAIGLAKVESIYFPSIFLLIGLSTLLTIMIGGLYYHSGAIKNVGVIVEFVMYINMLTFPVSAIGWVASMAQRAAASQKRINEFLYTKPAVTSPALATDVVIKGNIHFNHVFFTYPHTGISALQDFNLHINTGERIAIVGKTGSGKTTIAQLLLRMYDVQHGDILLDGISIRQMDLQNIRKQISYVPQDVFLFSDTIENNIKFDNEQVPHEKVVHAAQMADIASDIAGFPNEYQTVIGERGVTLSGGQKQRISIARALLKNGPIIVFDDCLSAVDVKTEQNILHNFDHHLNGKTLIVITHRVFSLLHFDKIIVLDNGRIVESGTHQYLLSLNGAYAALYRLQQKEASSS